MGKKGIRLNRILWSVFVVLLLIIAYIGLYACALSIPALGIKLERCPSAVDYAYNPVSSETNQLLDEIQSLRVALALSPECKELPEIPPEIAPPPDLKQSREIVFILDTSSSMTWRLEEDKEVEPGEVSRKDVALSMLQTLFESPPKKPELSLWRYNGCQLSPTSVLEANERLGNRSIEQMIKFDSHSALVRAILSIPRLVPEGAGKSPEDPMNVVLISDGDDNCKSDDQIPAELRNRPDVNVKSDVERVCAAARRVATQLPHLAIHPVVLDPSVKASMQCVKDATNGWFIESTDPQAIRIAIDRIARGK